MTDSKVSLTISTGSTPRQKQGIQVDSTIHSMKEYTNEDINFLTVPFKKRILND